jgi:osmoprotectant transport system ATP-binding protein
MNAIEYAIEYKNIRMAYGDKVIIDDFNLPIGRGEFVTIIGSSGCGKTTILKMANGLIRPTAGDVIVDGKKYRLRAESAEQI